MLCGATVAYKIIEIIYERLNLNPEDLNEYRQLAAIATIGDVVDLEDENRILVKFGLSTLKNTKNTGIRALADACQIDIASLSSYHIGFVIGPCLNAGGRLETARHAVSLLMEENPGEARVKAEKLRSLNEERKDMTEKEAAKAIDMVENTELINDNVLVVYLPECHESVAGIIAGRVKEYFYRPTFVITDATEGAKGSGRSIEGYNMFEEITRCGYLLNKFGGHPMAAGISLDKENIDEFRWQLNHNQKLTKEQLTPVTWIDVPMPLGYAGFPLIEQLKLLEPFGKGNEKPVFADKNLRVRQASIIGKNRNVLKMVLEDANATQDAVDTAAEDLAAAISALRMIPDKDALKELIGEAEAINTNKYTAKSVATMKAALSTAKAVLNDAEATEEEVADAVEALENSIDGLVEKSTSTSSKGSTSANIGNAYGAAGVVSASQSVAANAYVVSDTTVNFTLKRGSAYCFKMTVVNGNAMTPSFTVGNGDVLKTQFVAKIGNDYYYRVYATGTPGQSTGVYTTLPGQNAVKHCTVTIA